MAKTQTRKNKKPTSNKSSNKKISTSSKSSSTISPIRSFKKSGSSMDDFQKEIASVFLEMLLMVKLYHWKTTSYATHKATDDLYTKLNANIDSFIEVLLGKSGSRIDLMGHKNIRLVDLSSQESLKREVEGFKNYLVSLNNNKEIKHGKKNEITGGNAPKKLMQMF